MGWNLADKRGVSVAALESPRRFSNLFWIGLIVVCAVFSRCVYIIRPFDSDSAMFIYMGRLIAEGGRFQHDLIDNKFPTVGLLMSVPWRALGSNWTLWVMLGTLMSALAIWRLASAARKSFGSNSFRPTLIAAIVLLNFNFAVWGGFQLETIHVFFASIAAAAGMDALRKGDPRDSFLVGLAAATGAYAKPTALSVACALGITMIFLLRSQPRKLLLHGVAGLTGALIPGLVALTYLIATDGLKEMPALYEQISQYAKNSAWGFEDVKKLLTLGILAGFPFFVTGWIFRRREVEQRVPHVVVLFLVIWLLLELTGVILQRRMYAYHFMPLTAPLALLFGAMPRKHDLQTIASSLVPLAVFSLVGASNVLRYAYEPTRIHPASQFLHGRAIAGERVWQDDVARILLETDLQPGSRLPLTFLFANDDAAPMRFSDAILEDFAKRQPRYIVLHTDLWGYVTHQQNNIRELEDFAQRRQNYGDAWAKIDAYVRQHYHPAGREGRFTIWARSAIQHPPAGDVASGMGMR